MPYLNSELLDDPITYDGDASFTGGVVSLLKPAILGPSQCSEMVNIEIDRSGRAVTRAGHSSVGSRPDSSYVRGLFFYDWTTNYLMRVANGILRRFDGSSWAQILGFTPPTTFNVEMCQLNGTLYMTNGVNIYSWPGSGSAAVLADPDAPACKYLVTHSGRVFAGGLTAQDSIGWSTSLDGSVWDAASRFNVGGGDGQGITGLCSWQNFRLLVFKRGSIYTVNTDPNRASAVSSNTGGIDAWSVETVSRRIGCVNHRTIQQVGNDVMFLSDDGVRNISRTLADSQVGVSDPVSEPVQDIINRINWAYIDTASSSYFRNLYKLSVPLDSSTTPNYVIVWNQITQSWSGYWTGLKHTVSCIQRFGGISKEVSGQTDGYVFEYNGWKNEIGRTSADYLDNGAIYSSSLTTRGYSFGDYLSQKTGYSFDIEFHVSSSNVTTQFILDRGGAITGISTPTARSLLVLPLSLPFALPAKGTFRVSSDLSSYGQFYSIQCKLSAESNKMALSGFGLTAFLDTVKEES